RSLGDVRLGAAQLACDLVQGEQLPLWFHAIPTSDGVRRMEELASTKLTNEGSDEPADASTPRGEGIATREDRLRRCSRQSIQSLPRSLQREPTFGTLNRRSGTPDCSGCSALNCLFPTRPTGAGASEM